jgi:hypothetical protein
MNKDHLAKKKEQTFTHMDKSGCYCEMLLVSHVNAAAATTF